MDAKEMRTTPGPFVVGIDPGDPGGIAAVTVEPNPRLLYADDARTGGVAAGPQLVVALCHAVRLAGGPGPAVPAAPDDMAREITARTIGPRPLLAAIEGQFLGVNPHSVIELAHSAGQWIEAALNVGLLAELVAPSTWQARELSGGRRWRTAQLEAAARDKVGALWPVLRDRAPHVHAAVLIARWAALRAFWGASAAAPRPRPRRRA